MRDTIFISHAAPEDNGFAIWLAARLTALGFNSWVDRKALIGGEKFWDEIDHVIRNEACKFVLVYSKHICENGVPGKLKDGMSKEISLAESVAKQNCFSCFMLFLNLDDSPFNLFIGSDRFNQIPFGQNWATGLSTLVDRFTKDNLPRPNSGLKEFSDWFTTQQTVDRGVIAKEELYYTNLWPLSSLPAKFFIYQFQTENDAAFAHQATYNFPLSKISNFLTSFATPDELKFAGSNKAPTIIEVSTTAAIAERDSDSGICGRQLRNHLLHLLSRIFHQMMKDRGLFWCQLANKRLAYYYTPKRLVGNKVSFKYPFSAQCKTKHLIGRYKDLGYWHFALSCKPLLSPEPTFALRSHLIFTTDQFKSWDDAAKMHSHRRSKGKRMFNAEWRDLLLAFLKGLVNDRGCIEINLTSYHILSMDSNTRLIWSDFGYNEPVSDERLIKLADEAASDEILETESQNV